MGSIFGLWGLSMRASVMFGIATLAAFTALPSPAAAADDIRIGVLKVATAGPMIIAQDRGYFAKEGLNAELVVMESPTLVAQGVMSGDLDFGLAAVSAGFFNIAGQGAMRIIAGDGDESPGFGGNVVVVSNRAYEAGLKTLKDFAGHSFAIVAAGTLQQYDLSVIAEKYGFDYRSIRMLPVGSLANIVSAVVGGSADSAIPPLSAARQALADDKLRKLAWVGDEMRMQIAVAITAGKIADGKPELVQRFLKVFRAGLKDYHDAFTGADERPHDGPSAAEIYAIIANYTEVPIETMKLGLVHLDGEGRLNVADLMNQIAWYKSQGMVKPEVDGAKIIDQRYVVAQTGM
jgi:NitT/TauT family transport system substrate-binding protein